LETQVGGCKVVEKSWGSIGRTGDGLGKKPRKLGEESSGALFHCSVARRKVAAGFVPAGMECGLGICVHN
jgi:hypothetical protein